MLRVQAAEASHVRSFEPRVAAGPWREPPSDWHSTAPTPGEWLRDLVADLRARAAEETLQSPR